MSMSVLRTRAFPDGQEREIDIAWAEGGLCVHKAVALNGDQLRYLRCWNIAHSSGFYLLSGARTKKVAIEAARRFLPLANWDQPAEVLMTCTSLKRDAHQLQRDLSIEGVW